MHILIINGKPGVGKSQLQLFMKEIVERRGGRLYSVSSVDFVKHIAKQCGWDGVKTPMARKFLADLKQLLVNAPWYDVPFEEVIKEINSRRFSYEQFDMDDSELWFCIDVREPEEIKKYVKECSAITVLVRNERAEEEATTNNADSGVFGYNYDYTLTNNGSLDELKDKARVLLDVIRAEH